MSNLMSEMPSIEQLVVTYHHWLRDRTSLKKIRHWTEITTPFLDRHNDYVQIYAAPNDTGGYLLTDDGHTLADLEISGCPLNTQKRKEMLQTTLNGFGVKLENMALAVNATPENFALRKHNLIQAVLAVNDLFYLAHSTIQSLFTEHVTNWLDENGIRYLSHVKFPGTSGFDHVFDFGIPKSSVAPERILKAVTNPNRENAQNFAFAWHDTRPVRRPGTVAYAFLNDDDKNVTTNVVDAFAAYGIDSILWSNRESARQLLAA